jgi:hypothetical protein
VWCGVVWCGVVWCGVVWCGVVWCGVVLRGVHGRVLSERQKKIRSEFWTLKKEVLPYIVFMFLLIFKLCKTFFSKINILYFLSKVKKIAEFLF